MKIRAVDLFCGIEGLTKGLEKIISAGRSMERLEHRTIITVL